jgi:hypothetical protein
MLGTTYNSPFRYPVNFSRWEPLFTNTSTIVLAVKFTAPLRKRPCLHLVCVGVEVTLRLTVGQSVSQYVLVSSPIWDLWTDITSCRKAAIWKLWPCFCGALSLKRGLYVKHAVQRGIWVPTQHLLWDQEKPWKTLTELVGPRIFWIQSYF